jgi:hypothetical protein
MGYYQSFIEKQKKIDEEKDTAKYKRREYYRKNKEKQKERANKWYYENKEYIAERNRMKKLFRYNTGYFKEWYEKNKREVHKVRGYPGNITNNVKDNSYRFNEEKSFTITFD